MSMEATGTEEVRCLCGRLLFCVRNVKPDAGEIEIKCGKCARIVSWQLGRTVILRRLNTAAAQ